MNRRKKKLSAVCAAVCMAICLVLGLSGCGIAGLGSAFHDMNGTITGNTYYCSFYTNNGENFMNASGQKIDIDSNAVKELNYNDTDGWGYTKTLSSVLTITIDGKQIESCGSTIIFAEDGLETDVDFNEEALRQIESSADGFGDNTIIAKVVNDYQNYFGKSTVVVIQSQLGDPICAYSGDDVYWEVCEDLPKTTKLMVDGKALYIHRANFQIVDKELLK